MSKKIVIPQEILHKYYIEDCLPTKEICKILNISGSTLHTNLKDYNFEKRRENLHTDLDSILTEEFLFEQFISLNKSGMQISSEFNIPKSDVYRFIDKFNIKKTKSNRDLSLANRNYNVKALEENTPFFWHFLGCFFGDGTVINNPETRCYQIRIGVGLKTLPLLKQYQEILGGNIYLCERHRDDKIFYQYDYVISSKYIVDLFINKYNIQPNKTDNLHFPKFMDYDYYSYFLRGYLDSDGCVFINKKHSIYSIEYYSNSNKFLEIIQQDILKILNIDSKLEKIIHIKNSKCYNLHFGGKKRMGLGEYIYKDVLEGNPQTFYLKYKYDKFLQYY